MMSAEQSTEARARLSRRISDAKYRAANRERLREKGRLYRAANPDTERKRKHRWRKANAARINAYKRAWLGLKQAGRDNLAAIGEALKVALGQNSIYAAALAAVPRHLSPDIRDDVISSIVLAVLEGEIAEADIGRFAKKYLSAHYREFSKFKFQSLDAVIPGTDSLRLIDTIASDAVHF